MKLMQRVVMAAALTALSSVAVAADSNLPIERRSSPGAAVTAAFANLFYAPIRLGITVVSAELGGLTGFLTGGNSHAAEDVWGVFDGQAILTLDAVQGLEPVRFGNFEGRLLLIEPGYY